MARDDGITIPSLPIAPTRLVPEDQHHVTLFVFLERVLNCLSVKNQKHNTANNQTITKNKAKKEEKRNKL